MSRPDPSGDYHVWIYDEGRQWEYEQQASRCLHHVCAAARKMDSTVQAPTRHHAKPWQPHPAKHRVATPCGFMWFTPRTLQFYRNVYGDGDG